MTTANESQVTPRRAPVSQANRVAAAQLYVVASEKLGEPVPDRIRKLAASKTTRTRQQSTSLKSMATNRVGAVSGRFVSKKRAKRRAARSAN